MKELWKPTTLDSVFPPLGDHPTPEELKTAINDRGRFVQLFLGWYPYFPRPPDTPEMKPEYDARTTVERFAQ